MYLIFFCGKSFKYMFLIGLKTQFKLSKTKVSSDKYVEWTSDMRNEQKTLKILLKLFLEYAAQTFISWNWICNQDF